MELSVIKTDGSLRLVLPKRLVAELGWEEGDVLEFRVRESIVELKNLGKNTPGEVSLRRRLKRFGGSFAVTIPREVKGRVDGSSVVVKRLGEKLVILGSRRRGRGEDESERLCKGG